MSHDFSIGPMRPEMPPEATSMPPASNDTEAKNDKNIFDLVNDNSASGGPASEIGKPLTKQEKYLAQYNDMSPFERLMEGKMALDAFEEDE